MKGRLERILQIILRYWMRSLLRQDKVHPGEEDLACFLENKITEKEKRLVKEHLFWCRRCRERVMLQLKQEDNAFGEVPAELVRRQELVISETVSPLEIVICVKEQLMEVLRVSGNILLGNEVIPAAVLRSRQMTQFRKEVIILKDFKDIRVEVKLESKPQDVFKVSLLVKENYSQKVLDNLRMTLKKEDVELESYVSVAGSVVFEDVHLGTYTVAIETEEGQIASVALEINK